MGRRYEIEEALQFWLDGHAESEGFSRAKITPALQKKWDSFSKAAMRSLKKHLSAAEIHVLWKGSDEYAVSDVYQLAAGHGGGVAVDMLKHTTKAAIKRDVQKYVDDTGGGTLEDAFRDAIDRTGNPKRKRTKKKARKKVVRKKVAKKKTVRKKNPVTMRSIMAKVTR